MKRYITIILLLLFYSFAQAQISAHSQANIHKFVVDEVLQTTSYTYLLANENGSKQWLALPRIEAVVGEVYYYTKGMEMRDFKSKELERTFDSVLFLSAVQSAATIQNDGKSMTQSAAPVSTEDIKVKKAEGGITLEDLFGNKNNYDGTIVKVRGKVVKYNNGIMGKNWIHLQDGTADGDDNDLTVTTQTVAKVGDIITVEGIIVLDKDFGSGYFYKLIMEDAKIKE